jgi:hypothetical protein
MKKRAGFFFFFVYVGFMALWAAHRWRQQEAERVPASGTEASAPAGYGEKAKPEFLKPWPKY